MIEEVVVGEVVGQRRERQPRELRDGPGRHRPPRDFQMVVGVRVAEGRYGVDPRENGGGQQEREDDAAGLHARSIRQKKNRG